MVHSGAVFRLLRVHIFVCGLGFLVGQLHNKLALQILLFVSVDRVGVRGRSVTLF
jgi:hypothetical protein